MSIEIHRDQKKARAVERAAREFLPLATPSLAAELGRLELLPAAPDDGSAAALTDAQGVEVLPPDVEQLQRFAAVALAKAREAMMTASNAHRQDFHAVGTRREERDRVATEAYERVIHLRRALEGVVGERQSVALLGVEGTTPREPARLLEHLVEAVDRLTQPVSTLPPARVAGLGPDYPQLAAGLAEARDALAAAIEAVEEEDRRRQAALVARDEARERFRRFYVGWTRVLDGLYVVAGKRELAGRLRPAEPSASGTAEDGGVVEPPVEPPVEAPPVEPPVGETPPAERPPVAPPQQAPPQAPPAANDGPPAPVPALPPLPAASAPPTLTPPANTGRAPEAPPAATAAGTK